MSATLDPRRREAARLAELNRLGAMQPGADRVLQELVDDAREVFGTEYCMVNLVTSDTQFFKVWSGEMPPEVAAVRRAPRERTMCRHVVEDEQQFVVEDFSTTERFREQHLRMGPGIRFYAGTPLETSEGHAIGSLSLVDSRPRGFDAKDRTTLRAFARAVVGRLEALGAAAHEREAKESERRYRRNVFELANDAILIFGAETGLVLDANRRACEMYGLPPESLVGKEIADLSVDPEGEEGYVREVLHRGAHRGFETVHRRADGAPMDVSVNSSVTEYGGQRAILSIVRDVTGRKRTEGALRLSEQSLAQAQRIAHIGNWEYELESHRAHWSDEMYRIFGFAPLAILPSYRAFIFFVHPDDKERVRGSIRGALYGDGPEDTEYRIVRPDGEVRFVHTQYEVTYAEGGRPTKFVGTVQDVTDRKRVERRLEAAEERYRLLVEQIPAVAYIDRADVADVPFYTSPRIEALLGYTPGEWLDGRLWLERLHPDDRDRVLEADTRAREAEAPFGEEYRLIARDGREVWVRDESVLLRGEEGLPHLRQGVLLDITERKRAEEALRESEERYRLVARATNEVIWDNDLTTGRQEWDGAVRTMFGYSPQERGEEGRWWEDRLHPDDRRRVLSSLEALLEGGAEVWTQEYRFRRKDGTYATVEDRGYVVRDGAGGPVRMLGSMMDITERKRTEEELEESRRRLSALLSNAPAYVYRCRNEPGWPNEFVSDYALELTGHTAEELTGGGVLFGDLIVEEDRQRVWDEVQAGLEEDGRFALEYTLRRKDGEVRHVEERGLGVRGEGGVVEAIEGVVYDVTERVRAEGALREAERRYRTLVERIPAVTYVQEASGHEAMTYVSPQMEAMLGYAPEECVSDPDHWLKILHPYDRERVLAEDRRTAETGEPFSLEYRQFARDGRVVWVRDEAALVRDEGGVPLYWLGVQADVTERRRAEAALRESEERHRRQARELELLHQVRTALARELEPPEVFRAVVEVIARTYGYTQVSAYRLRGETLALQHQVGYERVLHRIPVDSGIMGRVARTCEPVLLGDVRSDPEFLGAIDGITSEVCVPLLDEGEVVGTLNVESTSGVELTQDDLRLMAALAEHVNVALGRARLLARVRASEERFRSLMQNASDVITLLEVDGTILYESPSIERTLGYSPDEMVGENAFDHIHPDDRNRTLGVFSEMLADPEFSPSVEYRFRHKDGSWRYMESIGSNLLDDPRVGELVINSRDITERKRWETKLREAEERYRSLIETIPAITYVAELDEISTPVYLSPQYESILGFTAEERVSTPDLWVRRLHPEDRERVLAANSSSNATGEPFDEEYRMVARDGHVVWMHDASVVLRGAEGRPSYRQGVMYDVTERRQTEEALQASELRMRTVIEQSPLGIHIFAPDGASLLTNGAWDELWYLNAEEAAQEGNVFEDEQLREAGLIRYIERSVAEGAPVVAPLLLFDPANTGHEGRPRWLRTLIYPVRGLDGRVLETVLLLEDFTERKRAEDALGESEERYRAVVEQSAEAIWMFDPETKRVLETNAAFQEMLGYDAEELRGMTNYDFVAHSREDVDRTVGDKIREKGTSRSERKYRKKDGTLLDVEVGGTVISYRGKEVVCSVARDITERKRVEEEIRETNRRLGELATLRADFTAMVAHELDTPLAVIRGYADMLATGELGPAEGGRALSQIQAETEVLNALVEDVRVAASAERRDFVVNPREVPVDELLDAAARFVVTLPGDHPLSLEYPTQGGRWDGVRAGFADPFIFGGASGPEVWADRYRIGQVLRNLLANAVKYSPEGSPIGLRTVPGEAPGRLRIEVTDQGPGIHPDDMERVFEKFGRGRGPEGRKVPGLGLGLYLSRRILRAHGSDLTVSAGPGGGSVFGFELEEVAR